MTAFADFLRAHRAELNARFAMARRRLPALEGTSFGSFLTSAVAPLVEAVASRDASAVGHAAYDVALELCGQRLAGSGAPGSQVGAAWAALLVPAARRIAEQPERTLAAAGNALVQLAAAPGARPADWAEVMGWAAPRVASVDEWLVAGQVAAWRAGLAHYRAGALAAADRLPADLALALVGAPADGDWPAVRARLAADPWHVPAEPATGPRVVARVGDFRGFGGLFPVPPSVAGSGDHFLVTSDGDAWVLFADAWGATFHRASDADRQAAAASGQAPRWRDRRVELAGGSVEVPVRGEVTSAAIAAATLAITSSHSHALVLLAIGP